MTEYDKDRLNQVFRERTGSENTNDPLVCLLYDLIRDHVTPGKIESIMVQLEGIKPRFEGFKDRPKVQLSNGFVARYAKDIVKRLEELKQ